MKFSERQGITLVSNTLQTDSMSGALRNTLWNVLQIHVWEARGFMETYYNHHRHQQEPTIFFFGKEVWLSYFKQPLDKRPQRADGLLQHLRNHFFDSEWYDVYNFIEFTAAYFSRHEALHRAINQVLEQELSGFRLVSNQIVPVTEKQEVEALENALKDNRFPGVQSHLKTALERLSDKKKPDYRNCVKESISAVEAMARIVTNDTKATLSDALKVLEKQKKLHPALKDGFMKLYGYTSDEEGIRHAMLDEPNLTVADAKYMLLSCTSFVNYLKSLL